MADGDTNLVDTFESVEAFRVFVKSGVLYQECFSTVEAAEVTATNGSAAKSQEISKRSAGVIEEGVGGVAIQEWRVLSSLLLKELEISIVDCLDNTDALWNIKIRIFHIYLPIFFWIKEQFAHKRQSHCTLILGLSAPQGCGKTVLVKCLEGLFHYQAIRSCVVSIDDFYLPGREQDELHRSNPTNFIFKYRGSAGTHDVLLGQQTLEALKYSHSQPNINIGIPFYDKSARNGLGDRRDKKDWKYITEPLDIVLFEGWMLGFKDLPADHPHLKLSGVNGIYQVNEYLREYHRWHDLVDCWIVMQLDDLSNVYRWRIEQERDLIRKRNSGLSDQAVKDFVDRFMPSYKTYLPNMYKYGPAEWSTEKPLLHFTLGSARVPISLVQHSQALNS